MKRILVVDDDQNLRLIMQKSLESCGYEVRQARDGELAMEMLRKEAMDLLITDLSMPGISGIELLRQAREHDPSLGCLVITAFGTVEKAVTAMKEGAFDFITKPFSLAHLESRIERYFEYHDIKAENRKLKGELQLQNLKKKLIGKSPAMETVLTHIEMVARSDATVFIQGPSGTGKELIAQAIHDGSDRAGQPFLKINCAAVPETLFESTLFGHEKGSFSGAYKDQTGIFEEGNGGTLLLDEISEIPYGLQAKLLRVLQERRFLRVGSTREIPVDVRIVATSNKDINEMIRAGTFREDLYFRLNVFPITVPSLAERRSDIPLLVNHFFTGFREKYNLPDKTISPEAIEKLTAFDWPGNVRQLEHMIERAMLLSGREPQIAPHHIPLEREPGGSLADDGERESDGFSEVCTLEEMERQLIISALKKTNNHRTRAAELLGISVRTLRNKLNQYDYEPESA